MRKLGAPKPRASIAEYVVVLLAYAGVYGWSSYSHSVSGAATAEVTREQVPALLASSIGINLVLFLGVGFFLMLAFNRFRLIPLTLEEQYFLNSVAWIAIFVLLTVVLQNGVSTMMQTYGWEQNEAPVITALRGYFQSPWLALAVGTPVMFLVAGLPEEFLRSYALATAIKQHKPVLTVLAVLFTSLAFASGHLYQGVQALVPIAVVGLIFAISYVIRPSFWTLVFMHTTYNVVTLLLPAFAPK